MSKNFELLHNISNEKDLFQTLDDWEVTAKESVTWVKPDIGPELNDALELDLEPETLSSAVIPESQHSPERAVSSGVTELQEPNPAKEESTHHEPPRQPATRSFGVGEGKTIGDSRGRKSRTRSAYKDPRREAIAHEEELKLVQRVFLADEGSPQMVLFSGFERNTGCATICIHAAEILAAQAEGAVCLVDMGFRVPSLHEYCGVQNERGLAEALTDSAPIQEFAQQLSSDNLWMIPSGYGASQLNSVRVAERLRVRMEELRKVFQYVVVHTGSLWLNAEAMLISKWTDGVVLILEANSTRRDTARRIKESLAAANARVLGVVLNNRTYPIPETLYSRL